MTFYGYDGRVTDLQPESSDHINLYKVTML